MLKTQSWTYVGPSVLSCMLTVFHVFWPHAAVFPHRVCPIGHYKTTGKSTQMFCSFAWLWSNMSMRWSWRENLSSNNWMKQTTEQFELDISVTKAFFDSRTLEALAILWLNSLNQHLHIHNVKQATETRHPLCKKLSCTNRRQAV